jgi:hypothetical protein
LAPKLNALELLNSDVAVWFEFSAVGLLSYMRRNNAKSPSIVDLKHEFDFDVLI